MAEGKEGKRQKVDGCESHGEDIRQRLRMIVAYDGSNYRGFQMQLGGKVKNDKGDMVPVPTIQGALEKLFGKVLKVPDGERVVVVGASRTDTGVHAAGQSCHLDLPSGMRLTDETCEELLHKLNMSIPDDISIRELKIAPPGFHAKDLAKGKLYHYRICCGHWRDPMRRNTTWWVARRWNVARRGLPRAGETYRLNIALMQQAANLMVGTHDFHAFRDMQSGKQDMNTTRCITRLVVETDPDEDNLLVVVEGKGFLFRMVRIIAAALVEVGSGRMDLDVISEALETRNRTLMPRAATPWGLSLQKVE